MLSNFSSCNTHSKANVGFFKRRSIVSTITSDSNNLSKLFKTSNKKILIIRARSCENSQFFCDCFKDLLIINDFDTSLFRFRVLALALLCLAAAFFPDKSSN